MVMGENAKGNSPGGAHDMESVKLQLLVTLAAVVVAAGIFAVKGPIPALSIYDAAGLSNHLEIRRNVNWGISVNARRHPGALTAVLNPVGDGRIDTVKLLIDLGADLDAVSGSRNTPLIWAAVPPRPELVKLLLDHGADPRICTPARGTALHALVWDYTRETLGLEPDLDDRAKRLTVARMLIDAGADVNATGSYGDKHHYDAVGTPLYLAICHGRVAIARLLIECGADVNAAGGRTDGVWDRASDTPLHLVASTGELDLAKLLLSKGAKVNVANAALETPLHYAARSDNAEIARLLVDHSAYVQAPTVQGRTPLDYAVEAHSAAVAAVLTGRPAGDTASPSLESPAPKVPTSPRAAYPRTVEDAVERLMGVLTDKQKAMIRGMQEVELNKLHHSLGTWIRNHFGLWQGNKTLLRATGQHHPDGASHVIIKALWKRLQRSGP